MPQIYRAPRRTHKGPERTFLIKARMDAEKTQEQIAIEIEERGGFRISRATIARWESGIRDPAVDALCVLADIYGMSLDELVMKEREFLRKVGKTA